MMPSRFGCRLGALLIIVLTAGFTHGDEVRYYWENGQLVLGQLQ